MFFFKGLHSLHELYNIIDNPNELRELYNKAAQQPSDFSLVIQTTNVYKYFKCTIKSIVDNDKVKGVILIFEEISEPIKQSVNTPTNTKEENVEYYASILNQSPSLIWEYDQNLNLKYANKSYRDSLSNKILQVTNEPTTHKSLTVNGKVITVEISTIRYRNRNIYHAQNITEFIQAKTTIEQLYNTQTAFINHLYIPMALYDNEMRLKVYNKAFVNFTQVDKSWLNTKPSYNNISDKLDKTLRIVSIDAALTTDLLKNTIDTTQSIIRLENNKYIHVIIIPQPNAELLFIYDNAHQNH